MSEQKLYLVEATYTYFVVADNEHDALDYSILGDAVNDAINPDSHTAVLDNGRLNPRAWAPQCLVYTLDGEEMTLEQARNLLVNSNGDE
jgi:hypothetical protein